MERILNSMQPAFIALALALLLPFLGALSGCSQEAYFSSGQDSRGNGTSENTEDTGLVEAFADAVVDTTCTDDSADAACIEEQELLISLILNLESIDPPPGFAVSIPPPSYDFF